MKKTFSIFALLLLVTISFVNAELENTLSEEDKSTFDSILMPVTKIYNFVKYAATTIAVLYLIFVGIVFITAGTDQQKRENAKVQANYIVLGLIIIWIAPLVVQYLTS